MIPQLRFPEFTGAWQLRLFDDIFVFSSGRNIKQGEASPQFDIPCVRYGELYHLYSEVIDNVVNRTNLSRAELIFSYGNEILLPSAGEDPLDIGSASALTIKDVAIGRTINVLRPKEADVHSQIFVAYYINSVLKKTISKLAKGNSISNVYNSDLKKLTINLPAPPEQQKIADYMTRVDSKLTSIQTKLAAMHEYKKGAMQALFSGKLRFKDESGNPFPDWKTKKLGELLNKNITRNKDLRVSYIQSVSNKYGFISQDDYFEGANIASKNTSNYFVIEEGTFAYNPSRIDVGSLAYKTDGITSIVSPLYVSFRTKDALVDEFLLSWFSNRAFISQMHRSFEGSVRNTLSFEALTGMGIDLPNRGEQQKIADFLTAIDNKIKLEEAKLVSAKEFKKVLLQRMFI